MKNKRNPELLTTIPDLPGVYFFKDSAHEILYIGKAKRLKTRLKSYFRKQELDWKVQSLIQEHSSIDYILTKNELEALLLEAQLIKEHKPKYNVLLKSGNPFLYIVFTSKELPEIKLVRIKKEKGTYFGPFLHKRDARGVFAYLLRTFKLRLCNMRIEGGCLDYHLGFCAGSCLSTFDKEEYITRIQLAQQALKGNFNQALDMLKKSVETYTRQQEFEKAKNLYEYIKNLDIIFATLKTKYNENKYKEKVFAATESHVEIQDTSKQALEELQKLLKLTGLPRVIDCFDISHFQSHYIVGSCIRFKDGVPDKNGFRRFKIKTLSTQNDYAALQEIVTRRYSHKEYEQVLPDLILIDGGKGQLSAITSIMPPNMCISLAKREERLFTSYHPEGICLDIKTPMGKLLIALRDYAHHFAISYHKKLRTKGARDHETGTINTSD